MEEGKKQRALPGPPPAVRMADRKAAVGVGVPHNRRGAGGGPAQKSSPSRKAVRGHVLTRGNPGCLGK